MRSDDRAGRSYGRVGTTPIVPGTGQRFGVNKLSLVDGGSQLIMGNQPDLILLMRAGYGEHFCSIVISYESTSGEHLAK
ncbi:hypothetical protein [Chroococcidiopsis sp. SAG 2025]|uniref:hypothetical protein n=1 Tax=Chroococcidiopsis sp. SAG 2025 TaxID=171389 RepID=UPI00293731EA|nr:hypothetical protein [Chroococcidiopsis sp. SAG 2025]